MIRIMNLVDTDQKTLQPDDLLPCRLSLIMDGIMAPSAGLLLEVQHLTEAPVYFYAIKVKSKMFFLI